MKNVEYAQRVHYRTGVPRASSHRTDPPTNFSNVLRPIIMPPPPWTTTQEFNKGSSVSEHGSSVALENGWAFLHTRTRLSMRSSHCEEKFLFRMRLSFLSTVVFILWFYGPVTVLSAIYQLSIAQKLHSAQFII